MKKYTSVVILIVFCIFGLTSCGKKNITPVTPTTNVSVKMGGVTKNSNNIRAEFWEGNYNTLVIFAKFGDESLNMATFDAKIGVFTVADNYVTFNYGEVEYGHYYIGTEGALTITSLTNDSVSGTFHFTGQYSIYPSPSKMFTEGKFTCKLVRTP